MYHNDDSGQKRLLVLNTNTELRRWVDIDFILNWLERKYHYLIKKNMYETGL